jgi:endonuclease/exonuclease/phosphatase family metal-dependent hydrolase
VVGLQEVTEELREILRQSRVIQDLYTISDSYLGGFCDYDVVLMVRRDINMHPRWWSIDNLPTEMGRRCLGVDLEFAGTAVRIANIHLESSKPKGPERRQQLEQVMASLSQMHSCFTVLVGDMNICSSWLDENSYLDKHFVDVWPLLHGCDKPGFTEDTQINLMRLQTQKKSKQVRFDRILVARASEQQRWHARSIDLLGTREICKAGGLSGEGELSVFPSDHFGLNCIFEYV